MAHTYTYTVETWLFAEDMKPLPNNELLATHAHSDNELLERSTDSKVAEKAFRAFFPSSSAETVENWETEREKKNTTNGLLSLLFLLASQQQ